MEGTQSEKAPQYRDFEREGKVMKCTEVSELHILEPFLLFMEYLSGNMMVLSEAVKMS